MKTLLLLTLALITSQCQTSPFASEHPTPPPGQSAGLPNPETADKNAPDYQPAFAGQTRAQGLKTQTP